MPKEEREIEITRSFSRKLNMSAHGGKQYETADISCTVTAKCPADKIEKVSANLDSFAQTEVNKTIDALDKEVDEEAEIEVKPEKKAKRKEVDLGVKVDQDELEAIREYINDLTMAKTSKDLKAAVIKIKAAEDDLTADEKKYLGSYYKKRKAAIEGEE